METKKGKYGRFGDTTLPMEERLDALLTELTIEEKIQCVACRGVAIERLNLPRVNLGGEAAHGVEARNDQNGIGVADVTTSFPQPIGMSASWDREMIHEAGVITGVEARVSAHRHPNNGLSRWAPTIDLERDPRWGRNEEGYGEDPLLIGEMSSAYIRGMQGDHPHYLRIGATLKHFYANNTEVGRVYKNASLSPRNRFELYLEPFRRAIEDGRVESVMAAYNKINGYPGVLNPEIKKLLKEKYGLKGHVVSDGGGMELVVNGHGFYGNHAESVANAIKNGVDGMSDNPVAVEKAVREAYELGLLTEKDLDGALRNTFRTKLRLGVYDNEPQNPYDKVTEEDIDSPYNREICKQLSRESVVLLKNEKDFLPLNPAEVADLALIGPHGDVWYPDWYGGIPPYRKTLKEGITETVGKEIAFADGLDRVVFTCDGKGLVIMEDGTVELGEEPDVFVRQDWGEGSITYRSVRTGKYLTTRDAGTKGDESFIAADSTWPYSWFVKEIFHEEEIEGSMLLRNRFYHPIQWNEEGKLISKESGTCIKLTMEVVENGLEKACALAKGKKAVILAIGCSSMINAKEEIDRNTIDLPPAQAALARAIYEANPNVALVLFANYPYAINWEQNNLPAILWSATGSQDMGTAMAECLFGCYAPAGRLNMTWYQSDHQLPDIDDYDIIKGKRTYRYFDGEVLYPFGYGLTYTTFAYEDLKVELVDKIQLKVSFRVQNTGKVRSDEVVQVYGSAPASRVKKPIRQLLGFERIKGVEPGESRQVVIWAKVEDLRFYDVISEHLMVEEGLYEIAVGASCKDCALVEKVEIPGEQTGTRNTKAKIKADHFDDYENISLDVGNFGYTACVPLNKQEQGILYYGDCTLEEGLATVYVHAMCPSESTIEVLVDGESVGSFTGTTISYLPGPRRHPDPMLGDLEEKQRTEKDPKYANIRIPLTKEVVAGEKRTVTIKVNGPARLCYFWFE